MTGTVHALFSGRRTMRGRWRARWRRLCSASHREHPREAPSRQGQLCRAAGGSSPPSCSATSGVPSLEPSSAGRGASSSPAAARSSSTRSKLAPDTGRARVRATGRRVRARRGGTETLKAAVRVVVATNRNLDEAVRDGSFRSDLLYRLNVMPILVPPLRGGVTSGGSRSTSCATTRASSASGSRAGRARRVPVAG